MPIYTNRCKHMLKNGESCPSTCKAEYCAKHLYHKKGIPYQKTGDYSTCYFENCTVQTRSQYGYCSKHSQHQRYQRYKKLKNS